MPKSKRILELNPDNALVTALQGKFGSEGDDRSALEPTAKLVYAAAVLAEGGDLDDPAEVAKLLAETLTQNLG